MYLKDFLVKGQFFLRLHVSVPFLVCRSPDGFKSFTEYSLIRKTWCRSSTVRQIPLVVLKTTLCLSILMLLAVAGSSQINPPDFLCQRSDTLFWNPASNTCGSFVATNIYTSTNRQGPYSLLTTINDPATTSFEHKAPGQNFYYLTTDADCPGLVALTSDTLDNRNPVETVIDVVTVEGEDVRISWFANADPETIGYVIYRTTSRGTTPIDTVFGELEYLDTDASPGTGFETYNVVALDACGNQGAFDVPHTSIFLEAEDDFCGKRIVLTWTNYTGWPTGGENNQIWLGIGGRPIEFEHRLSWEDTLSGVLNIKDDTEYCLQMVSKKNGSNVTARSNIVCLTSDVLSPLENLTIRNVTVTDDDQVEVLWDYTSLADLTELQLNRGDDSLELLPLPNNIDGQPPNDTNVYVDLAADVQNQAYYYGLVAVDDCQTMFASDTISSILLELDTRNGDENWLSWTPFFLTGRSLVEFSVCKIESTGELLLSTVNDGTRSYLDLVDQAQVAAPACYVIKATHTNGAGGDQQIARSNVKCIDQQTVMYVPNAFSPTGVNKIFKPEFLFQNSITSYTFRIFNRWGGQLFESGDPDTGWDGSVDGQLCTPGTYLYAIEITLTDGSSEAKGGTVHLLR